MSRTSVVVPELIVTLPSEPSPNFPHEMSSIFFTKAEFTGFVVSAPVVSDEKSYSVCFSFVSAIVV
jgi:hypothetical protein